LGEHLLLKRAFHETSPRQAHLSGDRLAGLYIKYRH
jgi:hypothetical protein